MKPHHALLVCWYILDILFKGSATPICLIWNTSNSHLTVNCSVVSANNDISNHHLYRNVRSQAVLGEEHRSKRSVIPFTSNKDNTKGEWECRHMIVENLPLGSFQKGASHMLDIDISAQKLEIIKGNRFNLTCFSILIPMKGVDIFVNNVLEDSIRYHGGKCFHKRVLCAPEVCTCSAKGQSFTWTYISNLTNITFTCEMRFEDEIKSTETKAELHLNGTVIIKIPNTHESLFRSDYNSHDHQINLGKVETTCSEFLKIHNTRQHAKNSSAIYWTIRKSVLIPLGIVFAAIIYV